MKKNTRNNIVALLAIVLLLCIYSASAAQVNIKLATTSTENSGLLYVLLPPFEQKYNIKVEAISVGTGAAIQLGKNGVDEEDADLALAKIANAENSVYFISRGDKFGTHMKELSL
ncbi:MAG: substrate-binding domain-containing protein [Atribacterota bacterium]